MTAQSLEVNELVDRRHWMRFDLDRGVTLTAFAEHHEYECEVEDISLGGAKLRLNGTLEQGCEVLMCHPSAGDLRGTCVWQASGAIGVAFEPPKRELEHLLQCISLILGKGD